MLNLPDNNDSKNQYSELLALIINADNGETIDNVEKPKILNVDISSTFENVNNEKPDYYSLLKLMGYDARQETQRYDKYDRHFVDYPKAQTITSDIPTLKQSITDAQNPSVGPKVTTTTNQNISEQSINRKNQKYEPHMSKYANAVKNEMLRVTKDISMPKFNSISVKSAGQKTNIVIPEINEHQPVKALEQNTHSVTDLLNIPKINCVTNRKIDQKYMVLPSLSVSDQITELERIIEGIKENIFDSGHLM